MSPSTSAACTTPKWPDGSARESKAASMGPWPSGWASTSKPHSRGRASALARAEEFAQRLDQLVLARRRQGHRRLVAALEEGLCRRDIACAVVAIAGHAHEAVLAQLLGLELVLDKRLARQVQHLHLAQVEAGQLDRRVDP